VAVGDAVGVAVAEALLLADELELAVGLAVGVAVAVAEALLLAEELALDELLADGLGVAGSGVSAGKRSARFVRIVK
jgi:hypothetical protein